MNLAPTLGKKRWISCSSQPTPKAAKLLAPEPSILFAEPQEKNISMRHLFHFTDVNPCPMLASCCSLTY